MITKNIYLTFVRLFLAWILFFQITRLVFVVWNYAEIIHLPINELLILPYKALYLDIAMICYLIAIPFLLFAMALFWEKPIFLKISQHVTALLTTIVSFISLCELPIYDEWHTKLTFSAVQVLFTTPAEVFETATYPQLLLGLCGGALLSFLAYHLFQKIVIIPTSITRKPLLYPILFTLLMPVLLILGLRGGYQPIPIQISDAYYSQHDILNLASTNSTFNLLSSYIKNKKAGKPYHFMPSEEANSIFSAMNHVSKDTTTYVLTTQSPNIVLVILEGWSGDVVKSCGGYDSISPNMENLIKQGIFFNNCYASGFRSEQGMAAIFSAFPAQPKTSIIKQPNKYVHLPCINTELKEKGYTTSFMFGGQLNYGNIKAYMYFNHFDKILEGKDFDSNIPQGRLGVHDQYLYDRQLQELSKKKQPFFAAMFTLSSHSPYDMPMKEQITWGEKDKPYLNSVLYADNCIKNFIEKAKKENWYKNTLFIFVSDHSHSSPKNWVPFEPMSHKIPFLMYGEVIKSEYRGLVDSLPTSQIDIASTLLHQLHIPSTRFLYSKNVFNPTVSRYAFYSFDEGFSLIKPQEHLCWHVRDQRIDCENVKSIESKTKIVKEGQSFLQVLMEEYFRY